MATICFLKSPMFFTLSFVFLIIISTINGAGSLECSLDFSNPISGKFSACEGGNWDGFLSKDCCGGVFNDYLYALGRRANETGKIFLNATEQIECYNSNADFDVLSCGIEKLTVKAGTCTDFTTRYVFEQLGDKIRSLNASCDFLDYHGYFNSTCSRCLQSWEELKSFDYGGFTNSTGDICRFTVLVTLSSSRIDDRNWILQVYRCLGELRIDPVAVIQSGNNRGKHMMRIGLWILIGGIGLIATIMLLAAWIFLRKKSKLNVSEVSKESSKEADVNSGCPEVPVSEIYAATNYLNTLNFIGQGTAGKVYKGVLSNGKHIAVKHIIKDGYVETFMREVRSLSHVRHPNLVTLLGHCEEEEECFLVYELCSNGDLSEWLFGKDKALSWIQRLEIVIDSARGLWFLHTYHKGCIVHRDIKPTNILLGDNFEAKLSDFGLSKVMDLGQSYVSSEVRGTFGYVDPEYQQNHHVNPSGDVYSFGIVLLQILSGKKVINLSVKRPMTLDKMAKLLTRGGSVSEFADPRLNGEYSKDAFDLVLKLALSCTAYKQQRPLMEQVVVKLETALNISTGEHTHDHTVPS